MAQLLRAVSFFIRKDFKLNKMISLKKTKAKRKITTFGNDNKYLYM